MIGIVALVRVKADKSEEFEAVFTNLARQVRAQEPGNLSYTLSRKQGSTTEYVIQELYADQAATAAHTRSAHYREARPLIQDCLAEPPVLHILEPRVGAETL